MKSIHRRQHHQSSIRIINPFPDGGFGLVYLFFRVPSSTPSGFATFVLHAFSFNSPINQKTRQHQTDTPHQHYLSPHHRGANRNRLQANTRAIHRHISFPISPQFELTATIPVDRTWTDRVDFYSLHARTFFS
jgi:hypothetical protein